jgi:hypothetical protein
VCGFGEERVDQRRVVLDGHRLVQRHHRPRKHFQIGVVTLVVLGDGAAEPLQITARCGQIRLLTRQRPIGGGLLG